MSEEQNEELEVLMSIFPEEYESISSDPIKFKLHLCPNPGTEKNFVSVFLICEFPPEYPNNSIPDIEIVPEKGLSKKQIDALREIAKNCATENIGSPSVFTIAEAVKEWLSDNNVEGQDGSMYADMVRRMQTKDADVKKKAAKVALVLAADSEGLKQEEISQEELERIRRRQAGKPVTVESFIEWKHKFDAENDNAGGYTSVVFNLAAHPTSAAVSSSVTINEGTNTTSVFAAAQASVNAVATSASASAAVEDGVGQLTGKQWFLLHMNERAAGSSASASALGGDSDALIDEDALIAAGENEELDEDILSRWASAMAIGEEEDDEDDDEDGEFDEGDEDDDDYDDAVEDDGGDDDAGTKVASEIISTANIIEGKRGGRK